jgi:hypothetical protein
MSQLRTRPLRLSSTVEFQLSLRPSRKRNSSEMHPSDAMARSRCFVAGFSELKFKRGRDQCTNSSSFF